MLACTDISKSFGARTLFRGGFARATARRETEISSTSAWLRRALPHFYLATRNAYGEMTVG